MSRINKLTASQEEALEKVVAEWLEIGRSTHPCNRAEAEKVIISFYEKIDKKAPVFFWMQSPLQCMLGIAVMKIMTKNIKNLRQNLWQNLEQNLWQNLEQNLRQNLEQNLEQNLWQNLRQNLWQNLGQNLRQNLWQNLEQNLEQNLWQNLEQNLRQNLWQNLEQNLRQNLEQNLEQNLWQNLWQNLRQNLEQNLWQNLRQNLEQNFDWSYYAGNLWCSWKVFYDFCNKIGVPYSHKDRHILDLWLTEGRECHFWWPLENVVFMSERPASIKVDDMGRLHCENGPAIHYHDGYSIWAWKGTQIPKQWIEDKSSLTPKIALDQTNSELRTAACDILGWANVLRHPSLNPKFIDVDEPHIGTLIEVDLPDAPGQRFIKFQCATGRTFAEPVTDNRFNTAMKANAGGAGWRPESGEDPDIFIPFAAS